MGKFSFDIDDSFNLFKKLEREYEDFKANKLSSDLAINFSITAYHLNEWIKKESNEKDKNKLAIQRHSIQTEFYIVRDLANGTKHKILKYPSEIDYTEHHFGAFSSGFSRGHDISTLNIHMKNGDKIYFEDVAEKIFIFWKTYFGTKE